jgi:PAS domain S-box-containing protein
VHFADIHQLIVAAARPYEIHDAAIIATDIEGTIVYWNGRAAALYGWRAEETIGRNIIDVIPTRNSVDDALRIMEELKLGSVWEGDFIVQHRDGRPLYTHVVDVPVRHENTVIGVVGVSRRQSRQSGAFQPASPAAMRS